MGSYNFFATNHEKNPCDGIGTAVKRKVRRASLQRPADKQILTALDMYNYLCENQDKIS